MKRIFFFIGIWILSSFLVFAAIFYITLGSNRHPDTAVVVTQLQEFSRYETASFTVETIIDMGEKTNAVQDFLFGDRLLLVAHGFAIAGFDLSKVDENNINISGSQISLTLPPPELLLVTLDNEKTQVFDRDTGILTRPLTDLEREARLVAEDEIVKAACETKLLETASENARKQLTVLFQGMGFSDVSIEIPEASCTR